MSTKSQTVFAICFGLFLAVVVTVSLLFADRLPYATQPEGITGGYLFSFNVECVDESGNLLKTQKFTGNGTLWSFEPPEVDGYTTTSFPRPQGYKQGNVHSTTVIIAPITSKLTKHRIPTHVLLKNPALERISIIMLEQIQTIDQSQLIEYMGEATVQEMNRIERASRISLGMQGVKRYE